MSDSSFKFCTKSISRHGVIGVCIFIAMSVVLINRKCLMFTLLHKLVNRLNNLLIVPGITEIVYKALIDFFNKNNIFWDTAFQLIGKIRVFELYIPVI